MTPQQLEQLQQKLEYLQQQQQEEQQEQEEQQRQQEKQSLEANDMYMVCRFCLIRQPLPIPLFAVRFCVGRGRLQHANAVACVRIVRIGII